MDRCPFCAKLNQLSEIPPAELVWQFPHSIALLGKWQHYTGYCILVSRTHAGELSQLPPAERQGFLEEMCILARAIESAFQPKKMNYELLGNQVPHLHWHLFPRTATDSDPLRAVWFALDKAAIDESERERLQSAPIPPTEIVDRLRDQLFLLTGERP